MIVKLVDDRDLWKFDYGLKTKWFHEYLLMNDINELTLWNFVTNEDRLESNLAMGRTYYEATEKRIESFVDKKVSYSKIPSELLVGSELPNGEHKKEYNIAVYNTGELISEIGSTVLGNNENLDFSICWFLVPEEDKVIFSLRSKGDKVNVSEIAKLNGGGGHFNAAGFYKSIEDGLELIKVIYKYILLERN
jgi:oligoribonuclease NrnB/cAMP/cGMP phosphodiesterase (DHH superfamily)